MKHVLLDDHILFREGWRRLRLRDGGQLRAEALEVLARILCGPGAESLSEATADGRLWRWPCYRRERSPPSPCNWGTSGVFLKHNSPGALRHPPGSGGRNVAGPEGHPTDGRWRSPARGYPGLLTDREQGAAADFEGLTNEIAGQLGVSEGAVKATLQQFYQRPRAHAQPAGARRARRLAGDHTMGLARSTGAISARPLPNPARVSELLPSLRVFLLGFLTLLCALRGSAVRSVCPSPLPNRAPDSCHLRVFLLGFLRASSRTLRGCDPSPDASVFLSRFLRASLCASAPRRCDPCSRTAPNPARVPELLPPPCLPLRSSPRFLAPAAPPCDAVAPVNRSP